MSRFLAVYEQDQEKSGNFIIRALKAAYNAIKKAVEWLIGLIKKIIRKIKNYINGVNVDNFGTFKIGNLYFDHAKREQTKFIAHIDLNFTDAYAKYLFTNRNIDPTNNINECNDIIAEMDNGIKELQKGKEDRTVIYEAQGTNQFLNNIKLMEQSVTSYLRQIRDKSSKTIAEQNSSDLWKSRDREWTDAIRTLISKYNSTACLVLLYFGTDIQVMYKAYEHALKYFKKNSEIPTEGYFDDQGYFDGKTHHVITED